MATNRIVVLTALPLEAAAVLAHLPGAQRRDLPGGTIVEEAPLPGTGFSVCLACTGPGNAQAALVADRVITWADPTAVFFVGVAGALKDHIALGDVIAATKVMNYQGGKDTSAGFNARPEVWDGSYRLQQIARYADTQSTWRTLLPGGEDPEPTVHFKPIASGDQVKDTADSALSELLRTAYNDAAAIEMEAAGVARAAHHAGVDVLVVRGISDRADGTKTASDDAGSQPRAARNAAAFALGVITALPAAVAPAGSATPGATPQPNSDAAPDWSVLVKAPDLRWRANLYGAYSTEPPTLEVHLAPVGTDARLQAVRQQTVRDDLVQLGRSQGLFTQAEEVHGGSSADSAVAFVRAPGSSGTTGLAVLRNGQRSAWEPLPKIDTVSLAIFDPDYLATRIAVLLEHLLAIPVPMPEKTVPVAGIDPAMLLTRGTVGAAHRGPGATFDGMMNDQPLRTDANEALSTESLRLNVAAVAQELAVRLDQALRGSHP
ncbi:5'-methylthioadenosine/S-adenosylhomocysteine nucleosidase [Streptomyces sp. NPDC004561]